MEDATKPLSRHFKRKLLNPTEPAYIAKANRNIGLRLGNWEIISFEIITLIRKNRQSQSCKYTAICVCGSKRTAYLSAFRKCGKAGRCLHCPIPPKIDMSGQQIGDWLVIRRVRFPTNKGIHYECQCKCGTMREITGTDLRGGRANKCKSCQNKINAVLIPEIGRQSSTIKQTSDKSDLASDLYDNDLEILNDLD